MWPECREENGALIYGGRAYRAALKLDGLFPNVSHDILSVPPDCLCRPAAPFLRCARLVFHGMEAWLLVNENQNAPLQTQVLFPTHRLLGQYDLWNNQAFQIDSLDEAEGRSAALSLAPNESLLVFACETEDEWAALPREEQPFLILENRDFIFEGEQKALCQKTYSAQVPACAGDLLVLVTAPEMAEVFIGGQCLGAAFWPPQEIRIPKERLPQGPFTLRLVLTGSRANQYGRPVPYGLGET